MQSFRLTIKLLQVYASNLVRKFTALFRGKNAAQSYKVEVINHFLRTLYSLITIEEAQILNPPTSTVCRQYIRENSLPEKFIKLDDGTEAYWIGSEEADYVLVYFHGGGYVVPMSPAQLQVITGIVNFLRKKEHSVSIVVLAYDLGPAHHYPRQLEQAVALMKHLLFTAKRQPSDISLIGDSAGGHLVLSLLSHISHPHPTVQPLDMSEPLNTAVLISPWTSLSRVSATSFKTNKQSDFLTAGILQYWGENFLGPTHQNTLEPWANQLLTPSGWWSNLFIGDILIIVGDKEVLRDDILQTAERIQEQHGNSDRKVVVKNMTNECHVQGLVNVLAGSEQIAESTQVIQDWLLERV